MEKGERQAINNGATIHSEKIAYVSNQPYGRADAFIVNDTISYNNENTQNIHLSFANLTNAEQEAMIAESYSKTYDMYDAMPNPGDNLRETMPYYEYTQIMEETDISLPNVSDMYNTEYIQYNPSEYIAEWNYDVLNEIVADTDTECFFEENNNIEISTSIDDAEADISIDDN